MCIRLKYRRRRREAAVVNSVAIWLRYPYGSLYVCEVILQTFVSITERLGSDGAFSPRAATVMAHLTQNPADKER